MSCVKLVATVTPRIDTVGVTSPAAEPDSVHRVDRLETALFKIQAIWLTWAALSSSSVRFLIFYCSF